MITLALLGGALPLVLIAVGSVAPGAIGTLLSRAQVRRAPPGGGGEIVFSATKFGMLNFLSIRRQCVGINLSSIKHAYFCLESVYYRSMIHHFTAAWPATSARRPAA